MKDTAILKIEKRNHSGSSANKRLRKEGFLPGNIYGRGTESIGVIVNKSDLRKKIHTFGRNAIFQLDMSGEKPFNVIIKDIQNSPIEGELHVDFQQISLKEEVRTEVLLKVVGKELLEIQKLILSHQLDTLTVKGLPQDIPDSIEIDVSSLEIGSVLTVGDIKMPKGIVCENNPEHIVVSVSQSNIKAAETETND